MPKLEKPKIIKQKERFCRQVKMLDKQAELAKVLGCEQGNISKKLKSGSFTLIEIMALLHKYPDYQQDLLRELIY